MKRHIIPILYLLTSLLLLMTVVRFNKANVKASDSYLVHNFSTGLNYTTIQEAIDANETLNGHMILVDVGTYYENLVVSKSVSLLGMNRTNTIIDGNGTGNVVQVTSDNVTISEFTIRNSGDGFPSSSILFNGTRTCTVTHNVLENSEYGLLLYPSNDTVVTDNLIRNNRWGGIFAWSSTNITVASNIVTNNSAFGIPLGSCSQSNIVNNTVTETMNGIALSSCTNNTIMENNVAYNDNGIGFARDSSNNSVYHNNFISNTNQSSISTTGNIWDSGSEGNYWSDYNGTDANMDGIGDTPYTIDPDNIDNYPLTHPYGSIQNLNTSLVYLNIQSAIDAPDTIDGHTIYVREGTYLENIKVTKAISLKGEDKDSTIIDGNKTEAIISVKANRTVTSGFTLTRCGQAINLNQSSNNLILDNIFRETSICIYMEDSDNTTIEGNSFEQIGVGILAYNGCNNTTILSNTINRSNSAIALLSSNNNVIGQNTIVNTILFALDIVGYTPWSPNGTWGVNNVIYGNVIADEGIEFDAKNRFALDFIANSLIYHNSFMKGVAEVTVGASDNTVWDNGFEGNYWYEYNGTDNDYDGIGDTPHVISSSNVDLYPLMGSFRSFNATSDSKVDIISNSTISDFSFNNSAIGFHASGIDDTKGFCRICIPSDLLATPYKVFVNGTETEFIELPISNSTHTFLYFDYTYSTKEVTIIAEFASSLVFPLLLIATLPATIICRRKRNSVKLTVKYLEKRAS